MCSPNCTRRSRRNRPSRTPPWPALKEGRRLGTQAPSAAVTSDALEHAPTTRSRTFDTPATLVIRGRDGGGTPMRRPTCSEPVTPRAMYKEGGAADWASRKLRRRPSTGQPAVVGDADGWPQWAPESVTRSAELVLYFTVSDDAQPR